MRIEFTILLCFSSITSEKFILKQEICEITKGHLSGMDAGRSITPLQKPASDFLFLLFLVRKIFAKK